MLGAGLVFVVVVVVVVAAVFLVVLRALISDNDRSVLMSS